MGQKQKLRLDDPHEIQASVFESCCVWNSGVDGHVGDIASVRCRELSASRSVRFGRLHST